jgi:hypothetical protein
LFVGTDGELKKINMNEITNSNRERQNLYGISFTERGSLTQNDRIDVFVVAPNSNMAEQKAMQLEIAEDCYVSGITRVASEDAECCPAILIL